MFKGHPKGLYALALANTGERFGYYTMLAVFALFLRENFGLEAGVAGAIYSTFLGLVYFMPLVGGWMADKFGFGRMVTTGIMVMFGGYLLLSAPLGGETVAMVAMMAALVLISVGTGLFKGNLQVMVGNLYDDPKYADKRDSGFSLFYMAINVGSLFAPTTAVGIKQWAETSLGYSSNDAYHFSFMVACAALVISILIYYVFRSTFRHVEGGKKKGEAAQIVDDLTPAETKQRIVALCLVFAVVIFFWMAFHQNGLTLTYFADEFTATAAFGFDTMLFDVWNLVLIIVAVYATFSIFQSDSAKAKLLSGTLATAVLAFLVYRAMSVDPNAEEAVAAPIFQQFNPFYVVALTPVSMAIFGALAKRGKEPSAPRKIAYGMMVAAIGFVIMAVGSQGLNTPSEQAKAIAVNKGESLAIALNEATDKKSTDEAIKKITDYAGKLTPEYKAVFNEVFYAYQTILDARKDAAADFAAANAPAPETTAVAETTEVKAEQKTTEAPVAEQTTTEAAPAPEAAPEATAEAKADKKAAPAKSELMTLDQYLAKLKPAVKAKYDALYKAEYDDALNALRAAKATPAPATEAAPATEVKAEEQVAETTSAPVADEAETEEAVSEDSAELAAIKATFGIETKPETRTSPYWLIVTYLVLTFAELLLSPMGISFVSKVAPPKMKGLMMGGWFVATAFGNMLVAVGGFLWGGLPLWLVWTVFVVLCLLSALFMFVMMKRLEAATK